jgi:hypothetical protein
VHDDSGIFGLNNQPVNFSSLGNTSTPTFFTALKDQGLIPSLSWSYTAGAQYRASFFSLSLSVSLFPNVAPEARK